MTALEQQRVRVKRIRETIRAAETIQQAWRRYRAHRGSQSRGGGRAKATRSAWAKA